MKKIYFLILLGVFTSCKKEETVAAEDCQSETVIQLLNTTNASCGVPAGAIEIVVEPNVSYQIDQEGFGNTGLFENLSPGIYTITAMDEMGCTETEKFNVFSNVSLSVDVLPIINLSCAISTCHVSGGNDPDFEIKSNIISAALGIKANVLNNTMPPDNTSGPSLSDAQIETIACWVDDGALDN